MKKLFFILIIFYSCNIRFQDYTKNGGKIIRVVTRKDYRRFKDNYVRNVPDTMHEIKIILKPKR